MAGYVDLLRQYANGPAAVSDQKKTEVASATAQKQIEMGQLPDMYNIGAARANDTGASIEGEVAQDLLRLNTQQIYDKYGAQAPMLISQRAQGAADYQADRFAPGEGANNAINDAVAGVTGGFIQGALSIPALGLGAVSDTAGTWAVEGLNKINEAFQDTQSAQLARRRRANQTLNELDYADNAAIAASEGDGLVASLKRIGRDAYHAVGNAVSDSAILSDGLANAGGSLLVGGPLTKGLKAIGKKTMEVLAKRELLAEGGTVAARLARVGDKVATPVAIGSMEAGGTYQQTVTEVLGMDHSDLMQTSADYRNLIQNGAEPEDAKRQIANSAGLVAAGIQFPAAALTGTLVSKFEANPLQRVTGRQAIGNMLREAVEEGIQSGTSQTATNIGLRQANENQDLIDGVGEQVGLGALYGFGSAGVIQAPQATATTLTRASRNAFNKSMDAVSGRLERIRADNESASPISEANTRRVFEQGQELAPTIVQEARTAIENIEAPEPVKETLRSYVADVEQAAAFDPTPFQSEDTPSLVRETLGAANNKFEAITNLAKAINDPGTLDEDRMGAASFLLTLMEGRDAEYLGRLQSAIEAIPEEHPELDQLRKYEDSVMAVVASQPVLNAIQAVRLAAQNYTPNTEALQDIESTTGQDELNKALVASEFAPDTIDPEAVKLISKHNDEGKINLTVPQVLGLQTASALVQAKAKSIADSQRLGLKDIERVTDEVLTKRRGRGERSVAPSVMEYINDINRHLRNGNEEDAKTALTGLRDFAQHFQNKLQAVNDAVSDNMPRTVPIRFEARNPNTGKFFQTDKPFKFHTGQVGSINAVQRMGVEATSVAEAANAVIDLLPALGVEKVNPVQIDSFLDRNASDVAEDVRNQKREVQAPVEEVTRNEPATESVPEPVSEPAPVEEAPVVEQEAPAPEAVVEDASTDVQNQEEEVSTPEQDAPEAAQVKAEPTTFLSKLLGSKTKVKNYFKEAFRFPDSPRTRTVGLDNPVEFVLENSIDHGSFTSVVKDSKHVVTTQVSDAYEQYLSRIDDVRKSMEKQLQEFLNSKYSKTDSRTLAQAMADGVEVNNFVRGRALNIVDETENGFEYNPELLNNALLASFQWMLDAAAYESNLDDEDIAGQLGIQEADVTKDMRLALNNGMSSDRAVISLADTITRYWGMSQNGNVSESYTRGIAQSLAGEIVRALRSNGLIQQEKYLFSFNDLTDQKKWKDFTWIEAPVQGDATRSDQRISVVQPFEEQELLDGLSAFPSLIEELVQIEPEEKIFLGSPPLKRRNTQLRSPVPLTKEQIRARNAEEETPHYLDADMVSLFEAMGAEGILELMDLNGFDEKPFNANYKKSLEGQVRTIRASFKALMDTVAAVRNTGDEGISIHYAYEFSNVNRMQMQGRYNPQANKLVREAILPTGSTLDMTQDENYGKFMLAVGQAIGVKIHQLTNEQAIADTEAKLSKWTQSIEGIRSFLALEGDARTASFKPELIQAMKSEMGVAPSFAAIHALVDYVKYLDSNDRENFKTNLYVEADGVTNGPVNAMMLLTSGQFIPDWVRNVGRGGVFFNGLSTLDQNPDTKKKLDLYKTASNALQAALQDNKWRPANYVEKRDGLLKLMSMLGMGVDFDSEGNLVIDRGVAKNPLTITIYGSGKMGIAGKLAKEITDTVYEKLSEANHRAKLNGTSLAQEMFPDNPEADAKLTDFQDTIQDVTNSAVRYDKNARGWVLDRTNKNRSGQSIETLNYDAEQRQMLQTNLLSTFVNPLVSSIEQTLAGNMLENAGRIQRATQYQSMVMVEEFREGIAEALKDKPQGIFLSQEELSKILDKLMKKYPMIQSEFQNVFVPGSQSADLENAPSFGRDFNDEFRPNAYVFGPKNAGVSGIPKTVISYGDGRMMQIISTMANAPTGTLKVFDGMHMKLASMFEDSIKANQAVYESWQGNPLADITKSFETTLKNRKENDPEWLGLLQELKDESLSITARQNALKRVRMSVDQMASIGSSFTSDGDVNLEGLDPEQITDRLNELYDEEMKKLAPKSKPIGRVDMKSGVRVLSPTALLNLARSKNLPVIQENLLRLMLKSSRVKDYRVIVGSPDEVNQWARANGTTQVDVTDNDQGMTVYGDKVVYVFNDSSETLVHELIHATTFDSVLSHFEGTLNDTEKSAAVENIQSLLDQFLNIDEDSLNQEDPTIQTAYAAARKAIGSYDGNPSFTYAQRQALALNEFMAWALANEDLVRLGEKTKATGIGTLIKSVVDAIKRVVFGRRRAPKAEDDLFSQLRFNTNILLQNQVDMGVKVTDLVSYQTGNTRLDAIRTTLQEAMGRWVRNDNLINPVDSKRAKQVNRSAKNSKEIVDSVGDAGFSMSMDERYAFETVVTAMQTGMELDPNVLSRAEDLYRHVQENLKVEDFIPEGEEQNPQARLNAQSKYNIVLGSRITRGDASGRSTLLPTFLALASTNDEFRDVLSRVEMPKGEDKTYNTVDGALTSVGLSAMEILERTLAGEVDGNARQNIDAMMAKLLDLTVDRETLFDTYYNKGTDIVDRINDYAVKSMDILGEKLYDVGQSIEPENKITKLGADLLTLVGTMLNQDLAMQGAEDLQALMNKSNIVQPLKDLFTEVVGRTNSNASIYDMIKVVRGTVEKLRQQYREDLPGLLAKKFSRKITEQEWTDMFHGLAKTDLAALKVSGESKLEGIIEYIQDPEKVTDQIKTLESTVSSKEMIADALALANFMRTGEVTSGMYRNAFAIARQLNFPGRVKNTPSNALVNAIDELTSLYAFRDTDEKTKASLASLAQTESAGLTFMLGYLEGQRNQEVRKARENGVLFNHYKGFIPSHARDGKTLIVAPLSDYASLIEQSYKYLGEYEGSSFESNKEKKGYFYLPLSAKSIYNQGILQNVQTTAGGVNVTTGMSSELMTAGNITDPAEVKRISQLIRKTKETGEKLLPVFDDAGNVYGYERAVDPVKTAVLESNTHMAKMIGVWRGRQVEEELAFMYNMTLVDNLKAIYDNDKRPDKDSQYIDLFDNSSLDAVQRDAVSLMNRQTWMYARSVFGDSMMVRKDMFNDAFGYRQASIGDGWSGISRIPESSRKSFKELALLAFGNDAYKYMVGGERLIQNTVMEAKQIIVIKSVVVPVSNFVSTMLQLVGRGVSLVAIGKALPKKITEVNYFNRTSLRLKEIELELRAIENDPVASRKLKVERQSILDSHKRLTIAPLIDAGELSSISDAAIGYDEQKLTSGKLNDYIEGLVDRLPDGVKTLGRYAWISKDTALFQGLQRAIEYGDFLGKAILYDELTKKKGKTREEALAQITEEFVNYDRLPGRTMSYADTMGLAWFWKFKLRSIKVGLSMMRNNPVHALLAAGLPIPDFVGTVGTPVSDNAIATILSGSPGYSLGPGQAFRAPLLNPWLNLTQ